MWSRKLDVEPGVLDGVLDDLLIQLGAVEDSDGLEVDRSVDGVRLMIESGQGTLDGADAAGRSRVGKPDGEGGMEEL